MTKLIGWSLIFLSSCGLIFCTEAVAAARPTAEEPTPAPDPPPPPPPPAGFGPKYTSLSHIEANGIGYPCGYTTARVLFATDCAWSRFLPLADLQLHYFNNNNAALNIGGGLRYLPKTFPFIAGGNVYYDFRNRNSQCYHEIGVGMELLGSNWDFRINGYIPIGHSPRFGHRTFHYLAGYKLKKVRYNTQFGGFNAEVGAMLARNRNFSLYAAGGTYYLTSSGLSPKCGKGSSWGGEGRLQPQYKDFIAVRASISHDSLFGTIFQGELILSLPLYPKTCPNRRAYQPIQRHPIIPLKGPSCCWKHNW